MNKRILIVLIIFGSFQSGFSQNTDSLETKYSTDNAALQNAVVIEALGKTYGVSVNYEHKIGKKHSLGMGFGVDPVYSGREIFASVYGVFRAGKRRSHFITSPGLAVSPWGIFPNLGLGYELEGKRVYFRIIPYMQIDLRETDYPILPSLGLYLGVKL
jgi:hypothetical protein